MKKRPAIPRSDGTPQTILLVEDVGRTAEFYQEVMRLEARDGDGERYVEFATGDGGVLLIVQREGSIAPIASAAAEGSPATLTFAVTVEGYASWKKWMNKRGVGIEQETKWIHGGRSLYVLDPDGRRIEFKAPPSRRGATEPGAATAVTGTTASPIPVAAQPATRATASPIPTRAQPATRTPGGTKSPLPASTAKGTSPPIKKLEPHEKERSLGAKEPAGKKAHAAPPVRGVVETILYTDNLPKAASFYADTLGLKAMTGDGHRFQAFDSGEGRVLLLFKRGATLEPVPAPVGMIPPHDGYGPLHIAFAIDAADYDAWCARIRSRGIAIESETHWDRGGRSLYFRDHDKHLVELVTPGIWPNY